ncbi:MAG: flagellar biosynthesis protein FlhA [Alphaproteobacteria bacterium]|nr:flagellar biosynthesis protein FlhA [Alphaproteobacteria bacterium]
MADTPALPKANVSNIKNSLGILAKRKDIALAFFIVCLLVILILPLATWMLDIALALSITISVLVLMTSIFIEKPIQFTSFPLILLLTTLYRLALNLSSTRLILSDGYKGPAAAGNVIAAFGGFIMRGNFIIGVIVFAILVLVNFMVITKGSGRIAEVAARFALDAMPGKQMAIDADLSSGLIDEPTARVRRDELQQESSFYGAMDGASKFVRGDAIAGLIITAINIIAGILIGVIQQNMEFMKAANTYMRLTVGDGLVSQVPALIVSVAAGIMVSKAGISGGTEKVLFGQLSHYPKSLGMTSFLSFMLATLPGTPAIPFILLSSVTGGIAYFLYSSHEKAKKEEARRAMEKPPETPPPAVETPMPEILKMDLVRLELGYSLLSLINDTSNRRLTEQIKALRRNLAQEMGFVMPSVRIQDNMRLSQNQYVILIKETEVGRGELRPNKLLVMDPMGQKIAIPGEETKEPTFGLPATWIDTSMREDASFRGYTVVDCPTIITTHITEMVKANMSELLSFTETKKLIDDLDKEQQELVKEILKHTNIVTIQHILQNLLEERVSIRDLPTILEGIGEAHGSTQSLMVMTELCRIKLSRQITNAYLDSNGFLPFVQLGGQWEQAFQENLVGQGDEKSLQLPPTQIQQFTQRVRAVFEDLAAKGETPVLLTSPQIRPYVRQIIRRSRPSTFVMSQAEVHSRAKIRMLGQL